MINFRTVPMILALIDTARTAVDKGEAVLITFDKRTQIKITMTVEKKRADQVNGYHPTALYSDDMDVGELVNRVLNRPAEGGII